MNAKADNLFSWSLHSNSHRVFGKSWSFFNFNILLHIFNLENSTQSTADPSKLILDDLENDVNSLSKVYVPTVTHTRRVLRVIASLFYLSNGSNLHIGIQS
jgi:hypothetical protein